MDVVSGLTTDEFSYEKLRIRTVQQYGDHPLRTHPSTVSSHCPCFVNYRAELRFCEFVSVILDSIMFTSSFH